MVSDIATDEPFSIWKRARMRNHLRAWRDFRRLTQEEVGERLGVGKATISKVEKRTRVSTDWLEKLSQVYGTQPRDLLSQPPEILAIAPIPPQVAALRATDRDLPVLGVAVAGDDADFSLNAGEPLDYVRRPEKLLKVRTAYAVEVVNDSMSPWKEPGDLAIVNPNRTPRNGDYVVLQLKPEQDGDNPKGFIKRLAKQTPTQVVLHQHNPSKDITIPRAKVLSLHKVMTDRDLYEY